MTEDRLPNWIEDTEQSWDNLFSIVPHDIRVRLREYHSKNGSIPPRISVLTFYKRGGHDGDAWTDLLISLGLDPPTKTELDYLKFKIDLLEVARMMITASTPMLSAAKEEAEQDLTALSQSIEAMRSELRELKAQGKEAPSTEAIQSLEERLDSVEDRAAAVASATQRAWDVPVYLPPKEDMAIRLVSVTQLDTLEQTRAEENKWFTVAGLCGGAVISYVITWVQSGETLQSSEWILLGLLVAFTALFVWTAIDKARQASVLRAKMREDRSNSQRLLDDVVGSEYSEP